MTFPSGMDVSLRSLTLTGRRSSSISAELERRSAKLDVSLD
jgi:hypothetical protein